MSTKKPQQEAPFFETDDTGRAEAVGATEFDYDAVDGQLGWTEGGEAAPPDARPGDEQADMRAELDLVFKWLNNQRAGKFFGKAFRLKLLCLAWVANPDLFEGKSLAQIAKESKLTRQALSRHAANAARIFGLRNRSQHTHGKNFLN